MSRLGRDYLKVGQVMEVLRQRGVRLIAINDGVDSLKGDDDFTPFRNIMNEFYARDTSRKIRSVFKSKGMSGKHLTGTVIYGYLWDEKREHWLVDEEAAEVVRRIFSLTLEGYGPYQIACKLSTDRIEIPVVHLARFNEGVNRSKPVKDPYGWGSSTIVNILKKREYLGHTINFKTRKHFKDKKSHYVSEDEWTIFENTHEAIIDQQTFDLAQKIRSNVRRYPNGWGEAAPLTGLLYRTFNVDHPADFKGHSLSVSDVVVLHQNGQNTAHYCDSVGFQQVPEFLRENPLRTAELSTEQNENMIDGVLNNAPSLGELEAKAKVGEQISLTDLAAAVKAEEKAPKAKKSRAAKPKKPSIRAQLDAAKKEQSKQTQPREKSKELEV